MAKPITRSYCYGSPAHTRGDTGVGPSAAPEVAAAHAPAVLKQILVMAGGGADGESSWSPSNRPPGVELGLSLLSNDGQSRLVLRGAYGAIVWVADDESLESGPTECETV